MMAMWYMWVYLQLTFEFDVLLLRKQIHGHTHTYTHGHTCTRARSQTTPADCIYPDLIESECTDGLPSLHWIRFFVNLSSKCISPVTNNCGWSASYEHRLLGRLPRKCKTVFVDSQRRNAAGRTLTRSDKDSVFKNSVERNRTECNTSLLFLL